MVYRVALGLVVQVTGNQEVETKQVATMKHQDLKERSITRGAVPPRQIPRMETREVVTRVQVQMNKSDARRIGLEVPVPVQVIQRMVRS